MSALCTLPCGCGSGPPPVCVAACECPQVSPMGRGCCSLRVGLPPAQVRSSVGTGPRGWHHLRVMSQLPVARVGPACPRLRRCAMWRAGPLGSWGGDDGDNGFAFEFWAQIPSVHRGPRGGGRRLSREPVRSGEAAFAAPSAAGRPRVRRPPVRRPPSGRRLGLCGVSRLRREREVVAAVHSSVPPHSLRDPGPEWDPSHPCRSPIIPVLCPVEATARLFLGLMSAFCFLAWV